MAPLCAVYPPAQDQLSACMSLYVEDQLAGHFSGLLEYVKKAEHVQKRSAVPEGQPIPGGLGSVCCPPS